MTEKRQIKKTVKDKDGKALVIINVSYPYYTEPDQNKSKEKKTFPKRFNAHYEKLCKAFSDFGENRLRDQALPCALREGFVPFGCVMSCIVSNEDEKYVSVAIDVSLSFGEIKKKKRMAQNWDKERGVVCAFSDVFCKTSGRLILDALCEDARRRMEKRVDAFYPDCEKRIRRYFKKDEFLITPAGYGFIFPPGALNDKNVPVTLTISKDMFSPGKG